MDIIGKLNWRYATKRMTGEPIQQEVVDRIMESIRLSPSSFGLQPYEIIVISNQELKEKIAKVAFQQPQVRESSHLIVFAAWANVSTEKINQYNRLISTERKIDEQKLEGFRQTLHTRVVSRKAEINFQWAARQSFIALGIGLVAAAEYNIDTSPLEGFNSENLDKVLGLSEKGLRSTVIMALGYRDSKHDATHQLKKVRKPSTELFTFIK